jgi:hypothetical protein
MSAELLEIIAELGEEERAVLVEPRRSPIQLSWSLEGKTLCSGHYLQARDTMTSHAPCEKNAHTSGQSTNRGSAPEVS